MNLLQALLQTYNAAEEAGLVDVWKESEPMLLPLYHSSRQSRGEDIVQLTISRDGMFLQGRFLTKGEYTVFPVSEGSLIRTANDCPHLLCDEFSYLAPVEKKKGTRHSLYMKQLQELWEYEQCHRNDDFQSIYTYLMSGTVRRDVLRTVQICCGEQAYDVEGDVVSWQEEEKGKSKTRQISLEDLFITFAVEHNDGAVSVSQNRELHRFFIDYVQYTNCDKPVETCDVSGLPMYCVSSHRGVVGTAKLIGISNHKEAYIGRFTKGEQVFHLGYETSQRIHNMLKYLLDTKRYSEYIGGGANVVSWMTGDLPLGGAPIMKDMEEEEKDDILESVVMGEVAAEPVPIRRTEEEVLHGKDSKTIAQYFAGKKDAGEEIFDNYFCVLVLEKVNNGRMAVKYFRAFPKADIKQRAEAWYESMKWPGWSAKKKAFVLKTPSVYSVVHFLYGQETEKGIICANDKVRRAAIERLLPCILERKPLPADMMRTAFFRLTNRQSYRKYWPQALLMGCGIIKKYYWDHEMWDQKIPVLNDKGAILRMDKRSFAYGRLLSVYEKMETAALESKNGGEEKKKENSNLRVTNAARLWSSMIHRPYQTISILEERTQYCKAILSKQKPGYKVYFEKILAELYTEIMEYEGDGQHHEKTANSDFILGYYYQQQQFYKKKDEGADARRQEGGTAV